MKDDFFKFPSTPHLALLGVDRSRLLGLSLKQFVLPEDYRAIDHLLETVFTKRKKAFAKGKLRPLYKVCNIFDSL